MRYDPTVYKELQKIRDRIPRNTYKTILGQLRAGDMVGAAMGVKRLQRQIAKADKEGGEEHEVQGLPELRRAPRPGGALRLRQAARGSDAEECGQVCRQTSNRDTKEEA